MLVVVADISGRTCVVFSFKNQQTCALDNHKSIKEKFDVQFVLCQCSTRSCDINVIGGR